MQILVVDDNVDAAVSLAMIMELRKHDVRVAHDGTAAIAMASSRLPHLVFLDIGMPGMTGYVVATRLRALPDGPSMFIVAVTGYGNDDDRARARTAGFDHHLTKPAQVSDLLSCVMRAELRLRGEPS